MNRNTHSKYLVAHRWTGTESEFDVESGSTHEKQAVIGVDAIPQTDCFDESDVRYEVAKSNNGSICKWSSDEAAGSVECIGHSAGVVEFRCEFRALTTLRSTFLGWKIHLGLNDAEVLSHRFLLQPLQRNTTIDAHTPWCLRGRYGAHFASLIGTGVHQAVTLGRQPAGVDGIIWMDHELARPQIWFDDSMHRHWNRTQTFQPGEHFVYRFRLLFSAAPVPIVTLGRYPNACRAGMTITDHADYDTIGKVTALFYGDSERNAEDRVSAKGFVDYGLCFTKSVFSEATGSTAGLHDLPFAKLCAKAASAGMEICPHGIHANHQPTVESIPELLNRFEEFEPRSWIDHGMLNFQSNLSRQGWNPRSEFYLLPHLKGLGIQFVWGFLDFGQSVPARRLNQLNTRNFSGINYLKNLFRTSFQAILHKRPLAFFQGFAPLFFQLVAGESGSASYARFKRQAQGLVKQPGFGQLRTVLRLGLQFVAHHLNTNSLKTVWKNMFDARQEFEFSPILYLIDDKCANHPIWLFNTVAAHDVVDSFRPRSIDELISGYGLHISHTYLADTRKTHMGEALVSTGDGQWRLSPGFAANLEYIAKKKDNGELWFEPISEIGKFLDLRQRTNLVPTAFNDWNLHFPEGIGTDKKMQLVVIGEVDTLVVDGHAANLKVLSKDAKFTSIPIESGKDITLSISKRK